MKIITKSGIVKVNKRSHYGQWLQGYMSTGAWSGWHTIEATWNNYSNKKPKSCSWHAWGIVCGQFVNPLENRAKESEDLLKEVREDWLEVKQLLDKAGVKLPDGLYLDKLDLFM